MLYRHYVVIDHMCYRVIKVENLYTFFRCTISGMVVLLMIIMIFTMSVKQYIYNYDPQTETTELFGDCKINITYIKMSDHYYAWELYSSLSK